MFISRPGLAVLLVAFGGLPGILLTKHNLHRRLRQAILQYPSAGLSLFRLYNVYGDNGDGWVSTARTEILSTELGAGEKIRLVDSEDVAKLFVHYPRGLGSVAENDR